LGRYERHRQPGQDEEVRLRGRRPPVGLGLLGCLAALALTQLACEQSSAPSPPATGTLALRLMDAPFPFAFIESTTVHIDSMEVHLAADGAGDSGFRNISRAARTFDLLELQHGVTAALATVDLPPGRINQLRMFVSKASVKLIDGRLLPLRIPSAASSGIKIHPDPAIEIMPGVVTDVLLDFDVGQSFKPVPASVRFVDEIREFRFRPVVRASLSASTGSLSGTIWNDGETPGYPLDDFPIAAASITVSRGGHEITTASSDAAGQFLLLGLEPGEYRLGVAAIGFHTGQADVEIVAGEENRGNDVRLAPDPF